MSSYNFDSDFFRRIISKSSLTTKIQHPSQLVREAVEAFYNEYDYYPEIGTSAPGVFTIMGDHLEYTYGKLVQGASPFTTVIVGKLLKSIKCKVTTTSKNVEGLRRAVFPITYLQDGKSQVFPPWMTFIKGIICNFPYKDINGFDILIHSNVPNIKGYGSSASLQVAFFAFLEAAYGNKLCVNSIKRGLLCREAESKYQKCPGRLGQWDNVTSSVGEGRTAVLINCNKGDVSTFTIKDIDILFLLTYPNFDIELKDREWVLRRDLELEVAARLLGLEHIKYATEEHLDILYNMEDPSRETVIEILRNIGIGEGCISEFLEMLFGLPKEDSILGEASLEIEDYPINDFKDSENLGEEIETKNNEVLDLKKHEEGVRVPCIPKDSRNENLKSLRWLPKPRPKVDYIHARIEELCQGRKGSVIDFPERACEKINCLGGLDNLSVDSAASVMGKLMKRLRHIITEKNRCKELSEIIMRGDYEDFGNKLIQSHLSLKKDFEVSCDTLDNLVNLAIESDGVYGAKMMSGGGILTLLHVNVVEEFIKKIKRKFGENFQFSLVFPSPGAKILNLGVKPNPKSALCNVYPNKQILMERAFCFFEKTYNHKPSHGAYAPGTVNLIGDHLDYNYGYAISMATSMLTVVVGAYNGTSKIRVATVLDVGEEPKKVIFSVPAFEEMTPGKIKWVQPIRGVVSQFKDILMGFDCLIDSSFPDGTGITNATVLIMAFYTFLEELTDKKMTDLCRKAYLCMHIEHDFLHVTRGVGDHTVSVRAKEDCVLLLDCRTLTSSFIPFEDKSVMLLLTLTTTKLTNPKPLLYRRMEECYKVAKALGGKTLRCLTVGQLEELTSKKVSPTDKLRAKHVILENERALRTAEALQNNDYDSVGELMVASHNSLRYNFEVTNDEVNFLVERALEVDGVFGSKMPCSGNMSCTITLVKRWAVDDLIEYLQKSFKKTLYFYIVSPFEKCGALNIEEYIKTLPGTELAFENVFPY